MHNTVETTASAKAMMNVNASYDLQRLLDRLRGSVVPQRFTLVRAFSCWVTEPLAVNHVERLLRGRWSTPGIEPKSELQCLASMCVMLGVPRWAEAATSAGSRYERFSSVPGALTQAYRSSALRAFVERHL